MSYRVIAIIQGLYVNNNGFYELIATNEPKRKLSYKYKGK